MAASVSHYDVSSRIFEEQTNYTERNCTAAHSLACSIEITFGSRRFLAGVKFTARFDASSVTVTISSSESVVAEVRKKTVPSGSTPKTVPA
jgi:hypothetical protein